MGRTSALIFCSVGSEEDKDGLVHPGVNLQPMGSVPPIPSAAEHGQLPLILTEGEKDFGL